MRPAVDTVGYKVLRQYPSVGGMLDEFRLYGFSAGVESILDGGGCAHYGAHEWITEEVLRHE